jgi:hypothetical protein
MKRIQQGRPGRIHAVIIMFIFLLLIATSRPISGAGDLDFLFDSRKTQAEKTPKAAASSDLDSLFAPEGKKAAQGKKKGDLDSLFDSEEPALENSMIF